MFVKMLGVADLLSAVIVILLHYDFLGWRWALAVAAYLLIKGWLFRESIVSIIDLLCGIYVFVMMFGLTTVVSWVVAVYLFQKACFSLAA
jgi:hypothetical protein